MLIKHRSIAITDGTYEMLLEIRNAVSNKDKQNHTLVDIVTCAIINMYNELVKVNDKPKTKSKNKKI